MSFNLSNLFDVYANNDRANKYLDALKTDAMEAYQARVNPDYVPDTTSSVREQAIADWEREKAIRANQLASTAQRNQIRRDADVESVYKESTVPRTFNANDPYSLVDRQTGRIIPMADAQAGGITPAQYLLATEMLKRRGYRGF